MRFLRILRFGAVGPRFFRQPLLPVKLHDHLADLSDGLLREIQRIGAHVGDQADCAFTDIDTLVKLLGHPHGLLSAEAKLAGSFLLQGRGGERRRGIAPALLAVHRHYGKFTLRRLLQRALRLAGRLLVREAELLDLGALILHQPARKLLLGMLQLGVDAPVFPCYESGDFILALANHAKCWTLHAAGRQAGAHLFPQQRREVESHQEIQRPPRLLRVHQVDRQLARARHRFANRILGDFVEHHPLHILALEFALGLQELVQVP